MKTTTPETDCNALLLKGDELLAARRLPEAVKLFCIAEQAGAAPDLCASSRWVASMLLGEFEDAWQASDSIRSRGLPDTHRFWQGEELAGRSVIVRCLHGYGDAVQFLRYAPMLKAIVSQLIVEVPPRFEELARCFEGIDQVVSWNAYALGLSPAWDVQIEVMELPYIFRTQIADLPLFKNYVHVPSASVFHGEPPKALRVGMEWNAGSWNSARSVSLDMLQPLLCIARCEFWALCQTAPDYLADHPLARRFSEQSNCRDSIEGLAATIAGLDLVITVDTLAAHLGGALGVTTWVLLPYAGDWRWMHDRADSPWYPSVRLFRQTTPGDWGTVVRSVHRELKALTLSRYEETVSQS